MIFQKGGSRPAIPCSELVFPPLTFLFFKGAPWRNGKMPICKKDGQADQPVRLFCAAVPAMEHQPNDATFIFCVFYDLPWLLQRNRGRNPDARSAVFRSCCTGTARSAAVQIHPDRLLESRQGFPACSCDILCGIVYPAPSAVCRDIVYIQNRMSFCFRTFEWNSSGRLFSHRHDRSHGRQGPCPDTPGTRHSSSRKAPQAVVGSFFFS